MREEILFLRVLGITFFICCVTAIGIFISSEKKHSKQIQTYGYLSRYNCWSAEFKVTHYTLAMNECSKGASHKQYGITRSGTRAVINRTIAVDPNYVPLGSILIDPETNIKYIAEDTGNGVKGYHVDIFMGRGTPDNVKAAQKFGVQKKLFFVIE